MVLLLFQHRIFSVQAQASAFTQERHLNLNVLFKFCNLPLLQMSGETGCAELCCPQVMAPSAQPSDPSARRESNSDPGEFLAGQRSTCTALKVGKGAYGPRNTGCPLESRDKFGLKDGTHRSNAAPCCTLVILSLINFTACALASSCIWKGPVFSLLTTSNKGCPSTMGTSDIS